MSTLNDQRPDQKSEQAQRDEKLEQITRTPGQAEGERTPGSSASDVKVTRTPDQAEGERSDQARIEQEQREAMEEDTKPHQPVDG